MENSEPKSFWKTLPGVITAIAGIITATTGLIIALNQAGFFKTKSNEEKSAIPSNSAGLIANQGSTSDSKKSIETTNITKEVKFPPNTEGTKSELVFKVLESNVEVKNESTNVCKVKVRSTANGSRSFVLSEDCFRLSADEVLISPSQSTLPGASTMLEGNSTLDETFEFSFPSSSKNLKLVVFRDDQKKEIPL